MKTIDVKGKPYVEVNERIKYFRANYNDWALESEIVSLENGVCVIKATVKNPEGVIKATGYAYEKENSTFINKTSYIENCETSAWGRALGNLGIGIDTSVASAEEILNAQLNQEKRETPRPKGEGNKKKQEGVNKVDDIDILEGVANLNTEDECTDYWNKNVPKLSGAEARKQLAELLKQRREFINE